MVSWYVLLSSYIFSICSVIYNDRLLDWVVVERVWVGNFLNFAFLFSFDYTVTYSK